MNENSEHRGYCDSNAAKYEQNVHPLPYIVMPRDSCVGLAIVFYVGFLLGKLCMGYFPFSLIKLTPFATSMRVEDYHRPRSR
jgi:hypothetical protein